MFRLSEYRFLYELGQEIGHSCPIDDYFSQELTKSSIELYRHFTFTNRPDPDPFLADLKSYVGRYFQFDAAKEIIEQLLQIENNIFHREFYENNDF